MKSLHLALLATAAAALTACSRPADPTLRTALDCPPSQGELTRTGVSPDRRACAYSSAEGDQISLRLIPVATSPDAALKPVEQELQALVPPPAPAKAAAAAGNADDGDDRGDDDSDRARISLPGINIDAQGDKADVKLGALHVNAADGGAVIREARDVRLRGEALSFERRGYRALFVVARSDLPDGLSSVGYEAGGPRKGPLAVAVVRTKGHGHGHDIYKDVRRLVRRNAGI